MDQTETPLPWFAVQVRPRCEKVVAHILENKGFEQLLPLYVVNRQRSDRVASVELPLFPGYLFCRLDLTRRLLPLFTTPGVVRLLGVGHTPIPIDDIEVEAVRTILKSGYVARPWPEPKEGERVCIQSGPLAGLEGLLVGTKKDSRLIVSVTLLQRAISVEIDANSARPVAWRPPFAAPQVSKVATA